VVQDRAAAPSVRLRLAPDRAYAVHLPWRSNDVGRRSRTVRSAAGSKSVSSRDGLERWSKGGGEKGRGTEPCIRRPTPVLLRVVSVPAECRASPRFIFWLGRACSVHRSFFSSAPRPALFTRVLDVRSSCQSRTPPRRAAAETA